MPSNFTFDKPSYEEYLEWWERQFHDQLGEAEGWYDVVTDAGTAVLERSVFWRELRARLQTWDTSFKADHDGYPLMILEQQPDRIQKKSFLSTLNKSFRRNILDNEHYPNPPEEDGPTSVTKSSERDRYDPLMWFGPHNWLAEFPDIFRTRFIVTYFDGVTYLVEKIKELAEETTEKAPIVEYKASIDGYHAAHLSVHHTLTTLGYDTNDTLPTDVRLEVQVTTTIQTTILEMLHHVYDSWRLTGRPPNWEWDAQHPAFAVNYLGNTLHYLEGMIVVARKMGG